MEATDKKKESNIQNQIILHLSMKYGAIVHRTNSGKAFGGRIEFTKEYGAVVKNPTHIRLCDEGTSDLIVALPNGKTLYIETKTKTGKQRESQKRFQKAIENLGHTYIVARSIEDIEKLNIK